MRAARAGLAACRPGATTLDVARVASEVIAQGGGRPAFEGYRPNPRASAFPGPVCISINDEAVHAPPGGRVLTERDLVTIDVGVELDGWFGDVAESACLPGAGETERAMLRAARRAVALAVREASPGARWSSVARAVRAALARHGMMALADYCGHGVGAALHEPPRAGYGVRPGGAGDFRLLPGMVLTIEPVVVLPPGRVVCDDDGWTVRTADGSPACHVERVVAITRRGARVLGLAGACSDRCRGL
jgi:methionyl aminopeptidase